MNTKEQSPSARVATLRAQRTRLCIEYNQLSEQNRSRREVMDYVAQQVADMEQRGRTARLRDLDLIARGARPNLLRVGGSAHTPAHALVAKVSADLGPLLVSLLGPASIEAALLRDIESIPEGLAPAEKAARLAEIEAELDRLEREEEALIEASAESGEPIPRRADANPAIVLGMPEEVNQ